MNAFITFRDKDDDGQLQYYILQRDFPHFVGVVSNVPVAGTWQAPISSYNLWVVFGGTLRGNIIPNYNHIGEEIQSSLEMMASWYYNERILKYADRFKKFKIQTNVPVNPQ